MNAISGWWWLGTFVVILATMVLVGQRINGNVLGILVDSRNRISLSRFQMALWTLLLLSAFLAIAFAGKTVNIYLPPELWALMGISTASTAGSVIVKGTKANQTPAAGVATAPKAVGLLTVSDKPAITDMFEGEEHANSKFVDIGKVQMFFFTLAVWVAYAAVLFHADLTKHPAGLPAGDTYELYFPALSQSIVTLLGISHAGYLTIKAAPNTRTAT